MPDWHAAPLGDRLPAIQRGLVHAHSANAGTPRYTAPEVTASLSLGEHAANAAVYTEKADIYSAALIVWYLLVGRRPERVWEDPRSRPGLGIARARWGGLAVVVEQMWAHDAGARPSAGECLSAVRGLDVRARAPRSGRVCVVQ